MLSQSYSLDELNAFASRFYGGKSLLLVPYAYNTTFSSLTAGSSLTNVINITANADFIATGFHHRANVAAAGQNVSTKTAPLVRMLVTDSGSNEQFTNVAVDLENYSTNGNIVNTLPYPRIVSGRSSLTINVTSYEATNTLNIDIMIEGVLVRAYTG
jgi:hypothetical protein